MDESILLGINQGWAHPWLDAFFSWISHKQAFTFPLLILILFFLIRGFGRSGWRLWLLLLLAVGLGDLAGNVLKHLIGALRPCAEMPDSVRLVMAPFETGCSMKPRGMPSNHALNFFLAAGFLGMALRSWRWGISFGLIAVAVSLSRVYLGVHYPSQVLTGGAIGFTLGIFAGLAVTRLTFFSGWLQLSARRDYSALNVRLLYSLVLYITVPLVIIRLLWRGLRNPDYWQRWSERFGWFAAPALHKPIWVHAVSVGEVQAALPLINQLRSRYPERALVVTTMTPTGSGRVRKELGDAVFHVYMPYDLPGAVERFINRVKPSVALIMETELWPNLFYQLRQRAVPIVVANARLSPKSMQGYHKLKTLTESTLQQLELLVAQSETDAKRFRDIGMPKNKIEQSGNIKFDLDVPEAVIQSGRALRATLGEQRPLWIAASTHEGEEQQVLDALTIIKEKIPDVLLMLVPRHPERFSPAVALCEKIGLNVVRRTDEKPRSNNSSNQIDVYVGDTLGELLQFYAAADVAFVGGSLVPTGGHNVLEPAALHKAVITGPHTFNFAEIVQNMRDADALLQVNNSDELASAVIKLLTDSQQAQQMGERGFRQVEQNRGSLERLLTLITPYLQA